MTDTEQTRGQGTGELTDPLCDPAMMHLSTNTSFPDAAYSEKRWMQAGRCTSHAEILGILLLGNKGKEKDEWGWHCR